MFCRDSTLVCVLLPGLFIAFKLQINIPIVYNMKKYNYSTIIKLSKLHNEPPKQQYKAGSGCAGARCIHKGR